MAGTAISQSWVEIKQLRIEILGKACELCGKKTEMIYGHHILGRGSDVQLDWTHCQLRDAACELRMHEFCPDGNNEYSMAIQAENNAIIRRVLEVTGVI